MTEREYFALVGQRPGMFVGKPSFHMLAAFLTGYDQHALRHGGHGLTGWHDWLIARRGRDCDHAWPGQVLHIALPNGRDGTFRLRTSSTRARSCSSSSTSWPPSAKQPRAHDSLRGTALKGKNPDDVGRDAGLAFRP